MFSQLFSKYLVEKDIITEEQRKKILEKQSSARVKMGTIAVADKLLTEDQAEELNQLQIQKDKKFGDLAIEKGYLSETQVTELLKKQGNPYMLFVQLMNDEAGVPALQVEEYANRFRIEKGFTENEMLAFKQDNIDVLIPVFGAAASHYITELVGLVVRNITRFVTTDFYIGNVKRVDSLHYDKMAGQKIQGDHDVHLLFCENNGSTGLEILARKFSQNEFEDDDDQVYDAVCEFTNCINGLFATDLSHRDIDVDMEPPVAYADGEIDGRGYVLPIYIEDEEISLFIAMDEAIELGDQPLELDIAKEAGTEASPHGKATVLIVDDSKMSRKILRTVLEKEGYQVIGEAVDGIEGVEEYKKYRPNIVTLDVTMPRMDGVEALRQIMEFDPSAKAIIITAAGQQKRIIEALKIGAKKFITKPFDEKDILENFERI